MKSENTNRETINPDDDIQPEYNLEGVMGERGKYYKAFVKAGYRPVLLPPDIAAVFKDEASVNEALRQVIALGKLTRQNGLAAKPKKTAKAAKKSPRFATTKIG